MEAEVESAESDQSLHCLLKMPEKMEEILFMIRSHKDQLQNVASLYMKLDKMIPQKVG